MWYAKCESESSALLEVIIEKVEKLRYCVPVTVTHWYAVEFGRYWPETARIPTSTNVEQGNPLISDV